MTEATDTYQHCAFHPDRRAGVVCQRCDKPICPSCMHQASVGFHCPDCVQHGRQKVVRGNAAFGRNPASNPLTITLIVANAVVFLLQSARGNVPGTRTDRVIVDYGLNAFSIAENGEWYRIITSAFLHGNVIHLLVNMWALWILGPLIERSLGRLRFAIVYAAALMAGSAGALILDPFVLTVGASGAIYGLMGALVIVFRERGISIWQSGLGITLLLNFFITLTIPFISVGGHVGGFVGGITTAFLLVEGRRRVRNPGAVVWSAAALVPLFLLVGLVVASNA